MCLNITAGFFPSCLLKNTINESRIGVNKKRHKKAKVTANSEDKNVANFKKKMNQKPYNKFLIDLVCSICTGRFFRKDELMKA